MEERIKILEERIDRLEALVLKDPWETLLDDTVREYIREHYPYCGSYDFDLYFRILESMKEQIKTLLMRGDH